MAKGSGSGGGRGDREGNALKTTLVVAGGLALAWLTMETAFKPFLDRIRGAISRSEPNLDPDENNESPPPKEEEMEAKTSSD